ncbi:hypothetical protein KUL72_32245 [Bradyrhizobium arachidis]|uniref:hypothetical protein n=1 Tax=Bradyrhizobium arachidis TaxID=858423 RepID=UPI002162A3F1|nr:hypothetical protein [Bradyrhizobium arachidis]UVO35917.1 hypothetical protein KUL72_32245 [Bradyrhizobium arachidis]
MLIDLALMLVAPESAEATISYWADFKSAREAVGSLMPISGRGPVFSFGVSRHLYRPISTPFEHSAEGLGPAKQTKDLALLERRRLPLKVSAPASVRLPRSTGVDLLNKAPDLKPLCTPLSHFIPSRERQRLAGAE